MTHRDGPSPSVSVVTPVYRAADYVEQAVRSALADPETLEVILVEDGCPDGSLEVCRRLAEEPRVRLLTHPDGANRGPSASRNLGIERAKGRYVAFLDADDYYRPGRFGEAVRELDSDPAIDGIYDAVETEFESEEARSAWRGQGGDADLITMSRRVAPEDLLSALVLEGAGTFATDGVVLRRSAFDRVGMFRTELRVGEDTDLWWRLAAACRLAPGRLTQPVAVRRRHATNTYVATNPQFAEAPHRIALSVYRWSRRMRIDREKRVVLLKALLGSISMASRGRGGRAWTVFARLGRTLASCPWLFATREFWAIAGGRALRLGR